MLKSVSNRGSVDIEELEKISEDDIGYCQNGDYHSIIAKALAYKGLGGNVLAIEIIKNQLRREDYDAGLYDYFHLGVLELESNDIKSAIVSFRKQIEMNDYLAETYYYLAIGSKMDNNKFDCEKYLIK